jgi:hypothetical protein
VEEQPALAAQRAPTSGCSRLMTKPERQRGAVAWLASRASQFNSLGAQRPNTTTSVRCHNEIWPADLPTCPGRHLRFVARSNRRQYCDADRPEPSVETARAAPESKDAPSRHTGLSEPSARKKTALLYTPRIRWANCSAGTVRIVPRIPLPGVIWSKKINPKSSIGAMG